MDSLNSMQDLFAEKVAGMYNAEQQLTKAIPKMAKAASSSTLTSAFEQHMMETNQHVARLEQIFSLLGRTPMEKPCPAMEGLITEGNEIIAREGDSSVIDAALICAAQAVEHYEISAYGTLRSMAEMLGQDEVVDIVDQTLMEEKATDQKLTQIAESEVNVAAVGASR